MLEDGEKLPGNVPAGPDNPLGQYAFRLGWPSYLIHGTNKPYGVGMRSSHGCMRLYPEDIAVFFDLIPIGTKVTIVNQPYLFGWRDGTLYLQAYAVMEDDSRDWNKNRKRLLGNLLSPKLRQSVEAHDNEIDWQRVGDLAHSPRAMPVPVTGTNEGIDAVLAQSVLVENTLPTAPTGMANRDCWWTRRPSTIWSAAAPRHRPQLSRKPLRTRSLRRCGVAGILLVCAFGTVVAAELSPIQSGLDYHSFANIEQFRVTHLELNLRVDFTNQVLIGVVALDIKRLDPAATELVLDTRDLDVLEVTEKPTNVLGATAKSQTTWVSRPFHFDKADPILGSALVIELTPSNKKTHLIRIDYQTSPSASALQWLTPKLNPSRHKPFLYTLSEPIGTRSWIPLQDTPQVRVTYSATIHTSSDWFAVMSAKNDPKAKRNGEYSFVMQDAVPPYLIALAVGDLRYKEIGPRTGIYAERSMLSAAAEEFSDAERLLQAGEKLFGPYRWDRFDLLVPPPSFPAGGDGESAAGLHFADGHRRGQELQLRRRPGSGSFLVGQSGQQRDLARFLDQRRDRRVSGKPHHE